MKNPAKTALITGAASGIGRATALHLAASGHALILVDRYASVQTLAQELAQQGVEAFAQTVDVGIEADLVRVANVARSRPGGCAILVNCAGITPKQDGGAVPLENVSVASWEHTHRINLVAPMVLCRELIPAMATAGYGRVVNVASRAGRMYIALASLDYHASKAGLIGLTRALAGRYAAQGVTVNCVAPGRVDTPMAQQNHPDILAQAIAKIPAGRCAEPREIAASIAWLASEEASYVTGICLDVNGGMYMN